MKPLTSLRNFTPTSIALASGLAGVPGVAVLGQMVHGQVCGVGVAVGGPAVGVGVGELVGGGGAPCTSVENEAPPFSVAVAWPAASLAVVPVPSLNRQLPSKPVSAPMYS